MSKSALGCGLEGDMDIIIQDGKRNFDSLGDFVKYFAEGCEQRFFKGKFNLEPAGH